MIHFIERERIIFVIPPRCNLIEIPFTLTCDNVQVSRFLWENITWTLCFVLFFDCFSLSGGSNVKDSDRPHWCCSDLNEGKERLPVCVCACVLKNIGSFLPRPICPESKLYFVISLFSFWSLAVSVHARESVTAPRSVVDIFSSTLLKIVTLNGCLCKILRNNSEFPARTWKETTAYKERHRVAAHLGARAPWFFIYLFIFFTRLTARLSGRGMWRRSRGVEEVAGDVCKICRIPPQNTHTRD